MAQFTVIHLPEDRLDEALPLVRMAAPAASAAQWRLFVGWLGRNDGGVLAAFAGDGRPHGVAAFRMEQSLSLGLALHVEPMVTFELSPSAPARAALCQALELLATARGCDNLVIATASRGYANPHGQKAAAWAGLGLNITSVALSKRLAPEPAELPIACDCK
ncbi:MAG TPA: hypothetical protein VFO69_13575 [Allosphingosinicella sp.]|nr:hypothetical protein [Allosphingosinicella sp.]